MEGQSTTSLSVFGDKRSSFTQSLGTREHRVSNTGNKKARPMSAAVKPSQSMSYLSSVGLTLKNANSINRKMSEKKIQIQYGASPGQVH